MSTSRRAFLGASAVLLATGCSGTADVLGLRRPVRIAVSWSGQELRAFHTVLDGLAREVERLSREVRQLRPVERRVEELAAALAELAETIELAGRSFQVLMRPLQSGGAARGQLVLLVAQALVETL